MKVLFSMAPLGFIRNFEPALDELARRGHAVHVVYRGPAPPAEADLADEIHRRSPAVTFEAGARPSGLRLKLAAAVRLTLDWLRYRHQRYDQAPRLRARAAGFVPPFLVYAGRAPGAPAILEWVLRRVERALPIPSEIDALFETDRPDVVLLTPLVAYGSDQVDVVRAARERGIPTVLGVASWDHLTTKGGIHEIPDRVVVWNESQKSEAVEHHGVPAERVVVTGAHSYDHWFGWPPRPRAEICGRAGLDPGKPYLLYLCSSPFIAPRERAFVERWLAALRRDSRLREVGVLVRPHPQNAAQWRDGDLAASAGVAVWPREGANPLGREAKADYYDSIHHSLAVVGLNTSGLVEAAIAGRPVYTLVLPGESEGQEGTLHFAHLHGVVRVARSLDEHLDQLAKLVDGSAPPVSTAFLETFLRPHGLTTAAAPLLADAVEQASAIQPAHARRRSAPLRFAAGQGTDGRVA